MRGLDPRIHRLKRASFEGRWIAGSSPAMTVKVEANEGWHYPSRHGLA
jgi:hypothetical protein